MNSVVIVGRVCTTPVYFPELPGRRSSSLYFCVSVGKPAGPKRSFVDVFNVRCYGPEADRNAEIIQKSQFVCVRGSVHLDTTHINMYILTERPHDIEIYTRLPNLCGNIDPALGLLFTKPRENFLAAVAACEEGDMLSLGNEIRIHKPPEKGEKPVWTNKQRKKTRSTKGRKRSEDNAPLLSQTPTHLLPSGLLDMSMEDDDAPILPSIAFPEDESSAPGSFPNPAASPASGDEGARASADVEPDDVLSGNLVERDPWTSSAVDAMTAYREMHRRRKVSLSMAIPPPRARAAAQGPSPASPGLSESREGDGEASEARVEGKTPEAPHQGTEGSSAPQAPEGKGEQHSATS